MEQSCELRTRLLLDMSADFSRQMAELHALREAVRIAEATLRGAEPFHPAVVGPSPGTELRP